MKKQLLSLVVITSMMSTPIIMLAGTAGSIKVAATVKTAFDFLSYPLSIIPVCAMTEKVLTPGLNYEIIGKEIAQGTAIATGVGLGLLTGMTARELYLRAHRLFGFSESEVNEIRAQSYEQQAWIIAQAAGIAFAILNVIIARESAKHDRERVKPSAHHVVVMHSY